jgi:type II secretory pathway pseudopilin PulG
MKTAGISVVTGHSRARSPALQPAVFWPAGRSLGEGWSHGDLAVKSRHAAAAFTLVEVLLALVLLAALLTAINQFVFSITEAWTKHHDEFVFVQHTRAVTRHLDEMLQTSANRARASNPNAGAPSIAETMVPEGGTADLLTFDLPVGDRLFVWPGNPLPEVQCALDWRKEDGLVLYWKSRLETDFDTVKPRKAVLSSFVTSLTYDYYDKAKDAWSNETEPQKDATGALAVPRQLRLHFHRKDRDYEEVIVLPAIKEGLPAY